MTNPADPLSSLMPLREPAAIGWWPPAPGWWLLTALLILGIGVAWYLWLARRKRTAYRRQALRQLDALFASYTVHSDARRLLSDCNALLKSVALRAFPAQQTIAAQHGAAWTAFLAAHAPGGAPIDDALAASLYRPTAPTLDTVELQRRIATWIREHRAPR